VTPPLGANLFMASQVGGIPFDDLVKRIFKWVLVMTAALLVITFWPDLSLILPRLFLGYGS
jgi:TRAP-type C4-dicarboxylate transport system, large permease component